MTEEANERERNLSQVQKKIIDLDNECKQLLRENSKRDGDINSYASDLAEADEQTADFYVRMLEA